MKRIMNMVIKQSVALGSLSSIVLVGVSTTANLSMAQEATNPLAEWLEVEAVEGTSLLFDSDDCYHLNWQNERAQPVSIGASYRFTENHPSFLDWTTSLISSPSETVAKREMYAVNVNQLSVQSWAGIVEQAASSDASVRLSVILPTEYGYVGTPVKWDQSATDAIANSIESSQTAGFEQNEFAVAYGSDLVARSLDSFSMEQSQIKSAVEEQLRKITDLCERASGEISLSDGASMYIGLSFDPRLDGIAIQPLTTTSGLGGERLGSEVPSWPYADRTSR